MGERRELAALQPARRCWPGSCSFNTAVSENLYQAGYVYSYAVVIDYNRFPARAGAGSAFFLHVTDGGPTAGCVSIPAANLVSLMRWLSPNAHPGSLSAWRDILEWMTRLSARIWAGLTLVAVAASGCSGSAINRSSSASSATGPPPSRTSVVASPRPSASPTTRPRPVPTTRARTPAPPPRTTRPPAPVVVKPPSGRALR